MASVDILNDKYRLDRLIGKGGFGEVYEATDLTLQRRVAVKLIKDANVGKSDMSTRFLKEARLTSQLKHPNTLTIYDFGKYNNQLFLVSELLEGEDLRARLAQVSHLQPHEMITLFTPICKALHEAHLAGIIHRDLKPDNLFLHRSFGEEKLVLLDFGIAKSVDQKHLTQTGHLIGTPHYMAPEQIRESKHVSHLADIYSLGIIFYEALSGAEPYKGNSIFEVLEQHLRADVPEISALASSALKPFDQLISSMLAKDPADRPQSALEIAERLEQIKALVPASIKLDVQHELQVQVPLSSFDDTLGESQLHAYPPSDLLDSALSLPSLDETVDIPLSSPKRLDDVLNTAQEPTSRGLDMTLDAPLDQRSPTSLGARGNQGSPTATLTSPLHGLSEAPSTVVDAPSALGGRASDQLNIDVESADAPRELSSAQPSSKKTLSAVILLTLLAGGGAYAILGQAPTLEVTSEVTPQPSSPASRVVDQDERATAPDQSEIEHTRPKEPRKERALKTPRKETPSREQTTARVQPQSVTSSAQEPTSLNNSALKSDRNSDRKPDRKSARRAARKSAARGLSITLAPRYTSYQPKTTTKLKAKLKSGKRSSRRLKVRIKPKRLGTFRRVNAQINQDFNVVGRIKWRSEGEGVVRACLGKQCIAQKVVIRSLKVGGSMDFNIDGVQLE